MDFDHWKAHWQWLLAALTPIVGWIGRRKGAHLWRDVVRQFDLRRDLAECQNTLTLERENTANERAAREYAMVALRELTGAASAVKEAKDAGQLMTLDDLPTAPSRSPRSSTVSQRRRTKNPLAIPSHYPRQRIIKGGADEPTS